MPRYNFLSDPKITHEYMRGASHVRIKREGKNAMSADPRDFLILS